MTGSSSTPTAATFRQLIESLLAQGRAARQRRCLVLAGEADWCRQQAVLALAVDGLARVTWLTTAEVRDAEVVAAAAAKALLGQERDALVFDAHAGFDPDAFGAVSGTLCAGGLMILLCPPLHAWPQHADAAAERIAIWPYAAADISGRFLQRLVRCLRAAQGLVLVEQGAPLPSPLPAMANAEPADTVPAPYRTIDQQQAVAAIEHVVHGHRRRPAVLVADRGRGKSAALGIAAARLLQTGSEKVPLHIVVTAPRLDAVQAVFTLAQQLLPEADHHSDHVQYGASSLRYVAPDVLCQEAVTADLVLVDEAAAIPATLLQQLLQLYARIAFATTTHGYEGTGRGFALRFRQTLDEQTPGWQELRLHSPIRWSVGDPLERLVFDALLLDTSYALDEQVTDANLATVHIAAVPRDELLQDETLLSQLFGLLVVAHYRTTPNDLRNLLDGPAITVYVMRHQGQVVATALVSREGGFDADTGAAIYAGQRRPRGHLMAQSLVTHVGLKQAGALRMARVMRIAVHPRLQGQGLGSALLRYVRQDVQAQDVALLGASFGASPALLRFWQHQALLPVRVGFRRDHASGEHSVLVLSPLTPQGEEVYRPARERLRTDLPCWLSDPLRELDREVVSILLASGELESTAVLDERVLRGRELRNHELHDIELRSDKLSENDLNFVQDFAAAARSFEDSLGPLWRLALHTRHHLRALPEPQRTVFIAKVWQKRSWSSLARLCNLAGRAAVLAQLRQAVAQLLLLERYS